MGFDSGKVRFMNSDFLNEKLTNRHFKLNVAFCNDLKSSIALLQTHHYSVLDVGKCLATAFVKKSILEPEAQEIRVAFEEAVERTAISIGENRDRVVFLHNLGILFEPEIGLNPSRIIADLSKRINIFLLWDGETTVSGELCWPTQPDEFCFDFSRYGIESVNLKNEI